MIAGVIQGSTPEKLALRCPGLNTVEAQDTPTINNAARPFAQRYFQRPSRVIVERRAIQHTLILYIEQHQICAQRICPGDHDCIDITVSSTLEVGDAIDILNA